MRFLGSALFVAVILIAGSCVEIPRYDPTPSIEFVGIDKFEVEDTFPTDGSPAGWKTVVRITLSFEDGDGDLGEDAQSETRRSFLQANGGWGNYHVQPFRFINEEWEAYEMPLLDYLVFPILKTDGVRGPIRGRLDYDLDFAMGAGSVETPMKFIVKIRDRELRESNVIETDSIRLPIFSEF